MRIEGREPLAAIAAVGSSSGMCSDSDDAGRRQKRREKSLGLEGLRDDMLFFFLLLFARHRRYSSRSSRTSLSPPTSGGMYSAMT